MEDTEKSNISIAAPGQIWRHVTGYEFSVLSLAIQNDGEVDTQVVVHVGQHDGRMWVRDVRNFHGQHASGVPRFHLVYDPQQRTSAEREIQ